MDLDNLSDYQVTLFNTSDHELAIKPYILQAIEELRAEKAKEWDWLDRQDRPYQFQIDRFEAIPDCKYYELTLTVPVRDDKTPYELLPWITKFITMKTFKVLDWMYVVELTDAGMPHIHALVATRGYVDKSKFKYPHRFELKVVRDLGNYINYLHKDIYDPLHIQYKVQYGLQTLYQKEAERPEGNAEAD